MDEQQKLNEFEAATYDAWLKLAERDLKGAPFDKKLIKRVSGVEVKPLYTRADAPQEEPGLPGFTPFARGSYALGPVEMGWDVRQEVAHSEPARAAQAILDNLNGGASSVKLSLANVVGGTRDISAAQGVAVANLAELATTLEHVDLEKTPVALSAGAASFVYAAGLLALAEQRGARSAALTGSLGLDPLGTLAASGSLLGALDSAYDDATELARFAGEHAKALRVLRVDTSVYHDAGADAATEIALALATGVEYLRALTTRGLGVDAALATLEFGFSVGRDFFLEIAKLRAARMAFAQVAKACGASPESQAMVIHAETSQRTKTERDPWVNLLRGTAESFSAAVGGADAIGTHSFDALLGEPDEFGQRMARNTQHLLRHEANLHRVVDPAGGSWYVESLTSSLVKRAWELFQNIEREGGLAKALSGGSVQSLLAATHSQDEKAVATRKVSITGVNEFPHVREERVTRAHADSALVAQHFERAAASGKDALAKLSLKEETRLPSVIAALKAGAAFAELGKALAAGTSPSVTPISRKRLAEPFEALRDAADAALAKAGQRPRVFLANLGSIPEHKARAGYAHNYLEAGGFEVLSNEGFSTAEDAAQAFAKSGASVCALCSSDAVYAELAESTAKAIAARGAKAIVLAGSPGEDEAAYRAAGVTDFIFMGTNLVTTLRALLSRAGVE